MKISLVSGMTATAMAFTFTAGFTTTGAVAVQPSAVAQPAHAPLYPAGTINTGGQGGSGTPGDTTGSVTGSGGGSGGGYHTSVYEGWAEWPEKSAVSYGPRTTTPKFKGDAVEKYWNLPSPHYNVSGGTSTLTLGEAIEKAWRAEQFNWVNARGKNDQVGTPTVASKCQSGHIAGDGPQYTNPLGFQYTVEVQWYAVGTGTGTAEPTVRDFHFGRKNSDGDWVKTGCQSEPEYEEGDRVCPLYLTAPLGWSSREAGTLPYGKDAALPAANGKRWITSPDEILGEATADSSVRAAWNEGTVRGGRLDPSGSITSDAQQRETELATLYALTNANVGWWKRWTEKGAFERTNADTYEKKSWAALEAQCGDGNDLSAEFRFIEARTGTLDKVLGHRFASTVGWTKRCPTREFGRAEFTTPEGTLVSERERVWSGCSSPSPLLRDVHGKTLPWLNTAIDQFTLTCPGLDADGFPNVRETGLRPYANGSWRNKDPRYSEFATTGEQFAQQTYNCQPVKPAAECKVDDPVRRLNPYIINNLGERKETEVTTPEQSVSVDTRFEKPDDVEVVLPPWVAKILTPSEQDEMKPRVVSRTLRVMDNGALPEFGDGVVNNEPLMVTGRDKWGNPTHPGESLLTRDQSQPGRGVDLNGYPTYSNVWLINGEIPQMLDTLHLRFVKGTTATAQETVTTPPTGRVEYADPADAPLVGGGGDGWRYKKVVAARGNTAIRKFLKASGLRLWDKATLTSFPTGQSGEVVGLNGGWRRTPTPDVWNAAMELYRPSLVEEYEARTGQWVLVWVSPVIPRNAVSIGTASGTSEVVQQEGVKSYSYPVWNDSVNEDGSGAKQTTRGAKDGNSRPFRLQLSNDWVVKMPVFEWRVAPYQPATPVVVGWEQEKFYGCGVAEVSVSAVKPRGGAGG